ncbi:MULTISPECIES: transporter family protein [Niastella]|uniref:Outer membrane protein beta-barrel domain-containing protein n=1 Tax=Niastella soli TaxID=2821487 RepID=A0ABS3YQ91_9BACT|nr:hypothetical protein [Niastella soli]MBO9200086.1 hypothetical protein [Niastella soli]
MKKLAILSILYLLLTHQAQSQGCVAIRSTGGFCTRDQAANHDSTKWMLSVSNRYFKSFRHFVGTEEQKQRLEQGTEVINHSYTLDLTLFRNLKNGWSIGLDVPVISNARSSLYEHGGNGAKNARHSTHSFGIGDIRIAVYKWLIDQSTMPKGNIQVGLGLKLPTGDYRYQDFFIKNDTTKVLGPVDQSIQLGDGGTGFTTEINAFYNFNEHFGVYGNFFYLINPREQNGVSTARGGTTVSADAINYGTSVMSVPDQMMVRAGASVTFDKFTFSAGVRDECQPSKDLIGGSSGFRRPGYIISIEPGVNYQFKKATVYAYVPFAVKRNRTQSNADKLKTEATGVHAQGDAAFADYLVNIGCSFKF